MATAIKDVLAEYATALTSGSAEIMIGAGISQGLGYPGWNDLLKGAKLRANVPESIDDAPLVAEYIADELGRQQLENLLLEPFRSQYNPGEVHHLLADLPECGLRSFWTTNYDTVLEHTFPQAYRVFHDNDYARRRLRSGEITLTKMHGSVGEDRNGILTWVEPPVITRSDYESYQQNHPLIWAELQARFLTNTFLFLGFSFNDPNIEMLLRLSRSYKSRFIRAPHYALMRRETDEPFVRLQDLRVRDLERSGIYVAYVSEFYEINQFLKELHRVASPPTLFISGPRSFYDQHTCEMIAESIQGVVPGVSIVSLGSNPAYMIGRTLSLNYQVNGVYDPEKIRYYYRNNKGAPVPHPLGRFGTAIYTECNREELLRYVLRRSSAYLCFQAPDSRRSIEELKLAIDLQLPIYVFEGEGNKFNRGYAIPRGGLLGDEVQVSFNDWLRSTFSRR